MKIKVLHLIKTSNGAAWALEQVKILIKLGIEVHVAIPKEKGIFTKSWESSGAKVIYKNFDFPVKNPLKLMEVKNELSTLIKEIRPNIIHSHFFGSTIILRSIDLNPNIKKIFQVPGPLHLENSFFRNWELSLKSKNDYWIASSEYIKKIYLRAGISEKRVFKSYYGSDYEKFVPQKDHSYRERFGIREENIVFGNLNYMYAPKRYLGQKIGLKRHEILIKTFNSFLDKNKNSFLIIFGTQWGNKSNYEKKLKKMASHKRIIFAGRVENKMAKTALANIDCLVHIPLSENCGGIIEPMHMEIPVIVSQTGGLPEIAQLGHEKSIISNINDLSQRLEYYLEHKKQFELMAKKSAIEVRRLFDIKNTAKEVFKIYKKVLNL